MMALICYVLIATCQEWDIFQIILNTESHYLFSPFYCHLCDLMLISFLKN